MTDINISKIKVSLIFLTIICFFIQLFFLNNFSSFLSLVILFLSNLLIISYCFNQNIFFKSPISNLIIFFSSFFNLGFALYFKTLELESISNNLKYSLEIILFVTSFNVLLILIHNIYLKISLSNFTIQNLREKFLNSKIHEYSFKNFIFFSIIIILLKIFYGNIKLESNYSFNQPLLFDVLNGFNFLLLSPIIIYYYEKNNKIRNFLAVIIIYFLLSIGFNSIAFIFDKIFLVFLLLFYDYSLNKFRLNNKRYFLLIFLILTPYFFNLINNFTYTYLQSREFRDGQNFNERTTTFFNEFKKFNLNKDYYKSKNYNRDIIFDDEYYKIFVLNRLNPIIVHDNFFILKNSLSTNQINQIKIYERNKLISIFPEPFLKIFNNDFNKFDYNNSVASFSYSFIDPKNTNPHQIGTIAGSLYLYFGYLGLILLIPFCVLVFFISDLIYKKDHKILPLGIFIIYYTSGGLLNSFVFTDISKLFFFLFREIPQTFILYYFIQKILSFKFFKN